MKLHGKALLPLRQQCQGPLPYLLVCRFQVDSVSILGGRRAWGTPLRSRAFSLPRHLGHMTSATISPYLNLTWVTNGTTGAWTPQDGTVVAIQRRVWGATIIDSGGTDAQGPFAFHMAPK